MSGKRTERLENDPAGCARAMELLAAGRLVAVPTETVYGLAARADQDSAVAAIYRAKGRPDFNPLIVHVASLEAARVVAVFEDSAERLAAAFWPGPLTLVMPLRADAEIATAVTAGLATIALRVPSHPTMAALLDTSGLSLAAPSANLSGAVSPTTVDHVASSLEGRIDAILDGGPCAAGLESTIVVLRQPGWQLLRPGPIASDQIEAVLGPPLPASASGIEAPGQLASHYSPGKPVRLDVAAPQAGEFMIGFGPTQGDCNLAENGDLALAAARLYGCLHLAAASDLPRVAVAPVPRVGIGAAINDRLRRAAS